MGERLHPVQHLSDHIRKVGLRTGEHTAFRVMLSRLIRLLTEPSTLIRTSVDAAFTVAGDGTVSSGMLLTPSEALNVKNGAPPIDTPTAANGAVVCGPRLSANDLRFSILTLKPEPVL